VLDAVDLEGDAPHGHRQLLGGGLRGWLLRLWRWLLLRLNGGLHSRGLRLWHGDGRTAWAGLDGCGGLATPGNGDAGAGYDTDGDCARTGAHEKIAAGSERSDLLAAGLGSAAVRRLGAGRSTTLWHVLLPAPTWCVGRD
jgi:hypothetical protein